HQVGTLLGLEDDLGEAVAVAKVDEDQPAVIAAGVHPAVEDDGLPDVGGAPLAASMGPLQHGMSRCHPTTGNRPALGSRSADSPYLSGLGNVKRPRAGHPTIPGAGPPGPVSHRDNGDAPTAHGRIDVRDSRPGALVRGLPESSAMRFPIEGITWVVPH